MKRKFPVKPEECLSTHGGSGYSSGSYWDNGAIVCGSCGTRIKQPKATSGFMEQPIYPDFIIGLPYKFTREGARERIKQLEHDNRKWYEFWK